MRTSSSSLPRKRKRKDLSPPDTVLLIGDWRPSVKHVFQQQCPSWLDIIVSYRTRHNVLHREQDVFSACREVSGKLGNRQTSGISGERCYERRDWKDDKCDKGNDDEGDKRERRRRSAKDIASKGTLQRIPSPRSGIAKSVFLLALLCAQCCLAGTEALAGTQKYCTRTIKTRYGELRGIEARSSTSVETYYGVPYATPPIGSLRYMPPVTPTPWRGVKFADTMPPVCPQRPPVPDDSLPRQRQAYLKRLVPILANQSEDCLYMNLYVPKAPHGKSATLS